MEPTERRERDRVTVIIPTFNRAAYLEDALTSVLAQDGVAFGVLVCDNASTDDTPDVIARHADPRVTCVRRPENVGLVRNFNLGFAAVTTEYVAALGDDDVMLPGALRRAVAALDANATAGFVHTAFDEIDGDGNVLAHAVDWTRGLTEETLEPGRVFIRRAMPWMCRVACPSAVIRTPVLPDPPFDPADGMTADLGMWLRIALDHDVLYLTTPGVATRSHEGRDSELDMGVSADGVFAHSPERITRVRDVKLRFIERNRDRLDDVRSLRRGVSDFVADELTAQVRSRSVEGRRALLGSWWAATTTEPRWLLRSRTWALLARGALGHERAERLRGRRG